MRQVLAGSTCMLVMATVAVGWSQTTDQTPAGQPIATRQEVFQIPFRIGTTSDPKQKPVEVQLFVTADRGFTWHPYDQIPPDRTSFNFRAEQDGEYWFFVRTRDAGGSLRPAGPERPELRVLVDTQSPQLNVTAQRGNSGEILAKVEVVDYFIDANSLTVQYRLLNEYEWQAVAVADALVPDEHGKSVVHLRWLPRQQGEIEIRTEVVDRAGNPAVSQIRTTDAVAVMPNAPVMGEHPTGPASSVPVSPFDMGRGTVPTDANRYPVPGLPAGQYPMPTADQGTVPWPGANAPPLEQAIAAGRVRRLPEVHPFDGRDTNFAIPGGPDSAGLANDRGSRGSIYSPPLEDIVSRPAVPPVQATAQRAPDQAAQMVNSRRFDLEYDVESVGPWGIRKVELWGTQDGGRTWQVYGVDDDNRSPITARVQDEGTYGFRILVQSGRGVIAPTPIAGDQPEVWVGVDLTPPSGSFIDIQQGPEEGSTELKIRWQADDARLASRPVTLKFAETPAGPWFPIAGSLPNSGLYTWHLDNRVPEAIYLRLEIRDEAGNQHVHTTPQAVRLNRLTPRGRIKDVRPRVGGLGQRNPFYR